MASGPSRAGSLTGETKRIYEQLSQAGQAKLLELCGAYPFDDDNLECFLFNHKKLTDDELPKFETYLQEEASRASKRTNAGRPAPFGGSVVTSAGFKRKSAAFLPGNLGALLGRKEADISAPDPKRVRENQDQPDSDVARVNAPDPSVQLLEVSVKSSVNDKIDVANASVGAAGRVQARVELLGDEALWTGPRQGLYSWMDESIEDRSSAQEARLAGFEGRVVAAMRERHEKHGQGDEESQVPAVGAVGVPAQSEVVLCGRVACEGLEGRLNEQSILLEGCSTGSAASAARTQLIVSECQRLAAFPGQIVGVLGRSSMSGNTFHARDFLPGLPPPPAAVVAAESSLHMVIAAGPYCLRDGLDYSPLERLLQYAEREKPQVLVLLGPFVDAGNLKVAAGDPVLPGDDEASTYEEVYTQHVLPMLVRGLAPLRRASPPTEVFVVPSLEEVLSMHPLPQPGLDVQIGLDAPAVDQLRRLGVQFLPNPAHLLINGLRFSLTSADALTPVLRELVLRAEAGGRKIDEALRLLLLQRSLFPVLPRDPGMVSEARAAALDFPDGSVPDICAFPSVSGVSTGTFVENTVFVNPGATCRPAALGTFAELWVVPPTERATSGASATVRESVRVDIKKLQ